MRVEVAGDAGRNRHGRRKQQFTRRRTDPAIAAGAQRLDEPRLARIVTDRTAQLAHGGVETALETVPVVARPERMVHLAPRDRSAAAFEQRAEQAKRRFLQNDSRAADLHAVQLEIDGEIARAPAARS
jgi:hypothetical protein